jgi:acetyltransferase-like isoleucine patch superfamily enzyme
MDGSASIGIDASDYSVWKRSILGGILGYINLRGEKKEIDTKTQQDLLIPEYNIVIKDTILGDGVTIWSNVNIYGAKIGENTKIGAFVEIRKGVEIGKNVKIEPLVFIPEGVKIGNCVFLGPNVVFTNDVYPRSCTKEGKLIEEYEITTTIVKDGTSIGAQSVIMCGITIGENALIGLGSTVMKDVPSNSVVFGEKAKLRRLIDE